MAWVYLSPHLDDAALSCGGAIWEQIQQGERVVIWTVCAGDPPAGPLSNLALALHERWQAGPDAVAVRREEDRKASALLDATWHHGSHPDGIYRRSADTRQPLYATEQELFGALHPQDRALVAGLAADLGRALRPEDKLVAPLALGGHVDHRLTREAAEIQDRDLWYYPDFPYVLEADEGQGPTWMDLLPEEWEAQTVPVSPQGLQAWQAAVAAHASQLSTFWPNLAAMRSAIEAYHRRAGGIRLWLSVSPPGLASSP